jgi:hypothetical protein
MSIRRDIMQIDKIKNIKRLRLYSGLFNMQLIMLYKAMKLKELVEISLGHTSPC